MKTLQVCLTAVTIAFVLTVAAVIGEANRIHGSTMLHASRANETSQAAWQEVRWPFLMDQWGLGRAFHCSARDCGTDVKVYVRAKIGFCNCTTGVDDDEEIDRIGDVELISAQYVADAPGSMVAVADMKGRARIYRTTGNTTGKVLAVAFSKKCDVMVATAVTAAGNSAPPEASVMQFLNSVAITGWAARDLGA